MGDTTHATSMSDGLVKHMDGLVGIGKRLRINRDVAE